MTRILALALALALPVSAFASSDAALTTERVTEITNKLTAEGYEVRKIDMEDGMIEAYVLKNGQRYELYLDAALNVVSTKIDD
ncbi:MAG: PepSY domain-containing protein [Marivita sp.]|jgi:Cu/Ag efflux protein CusF|uniref:PepSY domain-containing protein n=1 Tax=Marivita sp. TaxID=2003365 RepID=UPI001B12E058|nr:PepSY domain-containing protein [Marivita sp.]MBO6882497.1 PepSY domain-containing protein [Marivita sp.]